MQARGSFAAEAFARHLVAFPRSGHELGTFVRPVVVWHTSKDELATQTVAHVRRSQPPFDPDR